MRKIKIGVLTISDSCWKGGATDESGPNLVEKINEGIIKNGMVVATALVPDNETLIKDKLTKWCDEEKLDLVLTTGGTGVSPRDVTPEATAQVLDKTVPGISYLMLKFGSEITPLAALSRSVSGIRGGTLIINFPGSKKASEECLRSVCPVIGHAVDLMRDAKANVEKTHSSLMEKKTSKVEVINEESRKRKPSHPLVNVTEAQSMIFYNTVGLRREKTIGYKDALGFVAAADVLAASDLPPFDASLMDGYAVISADEISPKVLMGSCAAGVLPDQKLTAGTCMSINTGAALPEGADAVVPVEDTYLVKNGDEIRIGVTAFPSPGGNVRPRGFDFTLGSLLVTAGTWLGPSAVGLLAAAGVSTVKVYEKPSVAIMSTGDEIVDPSEEPPPGKVRDSNRITLIGMLKEEGFDACDLGIVPDDPNSLFSALSKGFAMADVVATTGSMSMGDRDYLKEVLATDFDAEILFGAVFMKPGKPTAFAVLEFEGKPKIWFGLPGNPASAVVTTHLFLLPALRHVSGRKNVLPTRVTATLTFSIKLLDRPHFHRGVLSCEGGGTFRVSSTGNQSSSRVGSCSDANCLIEVPDGTGAVQKGATVTVLMIDRNFQSV